jgi:hypothetical protein
LCPWRFTVAVDRLDTNSEREVSGIGLLENATSFLSLAAVHEATAADSFTCLEAELNKNR